MASIQPTNLSGDLRRNELGFLLPPKYLTTDRLTFERARLNAVRYHGSIGILSQMVHGTKLYLRRCLGHLQYLLQLFRGRSKASIVTDILDDLRQSRYSKDFQTAHDMIRATPRSLLQHPLVSAEAATVYIEHGHIDLARDSIEASILPMAIEQTDWMYRVDVSMLALISLSIDIQQNMDWTEALYVFENIEDVFLRLNCKQSECCFLNVY